MGMGMGMGMGDEGIKVVEVFMPLIIDTDFQSTYTYHRDSRARAPRRRDERIDRVIGKDCDIIIII